MHHVHRCRSGHRHDSGACLSISTCEYPTMITNTKLDPIETASVDELQALQTQRLKWTLKHAYENV
ncbi:TPA: phenylacetate--CoA ligase family protein, partial [Escherichia coli]